MACAAATSTRATTKVLRIPLATACGCAVAMSLVAEANANTAPIADAPVISPRLRDRLSMPEMTPRWSEGTSVMTDVPSDQRGVISGILNLSRNLGLITGASAMGAVFAFASATSDIATAHPQAVASGMRSTFVVALVLVAAAQAIAFASRALARRMG